MRLHYVYEAGTNREIALRQRQLADDLVKPKIRTKHQKPLHEAFCDLCQWPQDPLPVLEFAQIYGSLYRSAVVREAHRDYSGQRFDYDHVERASDWFFALRRVAGISALLTLIPYEDSRVPADHRTQIAADRLVRCSRDLNQRHLEEPRGLQQWHHYVRDHPVFWLEEIRAGRVAKDEYGKRQIESFFLEKAKIAFAEAMRIDAKHFFHRFDFPDDGGIKLEAWTLLGAIYASLYDSFAERKLRICERCGATHSHRAGSRWCSDACKVANARAIRTGRR